MRTSLAPAYFGDLVQRRSHWIRGHIQCLLCHGLSLEVASLNFRFLVFPSFFHAAYAPLVILASSAFALLFGGACPRLLLGNVVILGIFLGVCAQRLVCWFCLERMRRTSLMVVLLEPLVSFFVLAIALLVALWRLFLGAARKVDRSPGWIAKRSFSLAVPLGFEAAAKPFFMGFPCLE